MPTATPMTICTALCRTTSDTTAVGARAECHANTDLARPMRDDERQDTVDADRSKRHSDSREAAQQHGKQSGTRHCVRHDLLHRRHIVDGRCGIELTNERPNVGADGQRRILGPHGEVRPAKTGRCRDEVNDEHLGAGRPMEIELPDVLDDADDFPRGFPCVDLAPQSRAIEETAIRKRSADERLTTRRFSGTERSPLHDAQPDRLGETRADRVQARIRPWRSLAGCHWPRAHITREALLNQRQVVGVSNCRHARQGSQSRDEAIGKRQIVRA